MINWALLSELVLPEGEVRQVSINGENVWTLYQRVEYIEAPDDKPYMVTDIIADSETGVECVVSFASYIDRALVGSRATSGNTRFYLPYPMSASINAYYGYNAGYYLDGKLSTNLKYVTRLNFCNDKTAAVYDADGNALSVKGLPQTLAQQTTTIGVFRQTRGYNATNLSRTGRIYHLKISQGENVVREYIPAYRKSDGAIGLYELHTLQFLTNVGSGEFIKGQDIAW